jgi:flagellar hook protein FlgE
MGDSVLDITNSALLAQTSALSTISQNLANSSTSGYKATSTLFADLVNQSNSRASANQGIGATTRSTQNVDAQGVFASASKTTDMAINGKGFFCVSDGTSSGQTYYTRDGEFEPDSSGNLVMSSDSSKYLLGSATDAAGNVTSSTIGPINVGTDASAAEATTEVTLSANLPAQAQANTASYSAGFTETLAVYDSKGTAEEIPVTFVPQGNNSWTMTVGNPTGSDGSTTSGSVTSSATYDVTFNSKGGLASISGGTLDSSGNPQINIGSWSDGAASSSISLNLGTAGSTTGLTQYNSSTSDVAISVNSSSQDGKALGSLTSVKVASDGTVYGEYSNGMDKAIAKVAVASFTNDNGLQATSGNLYEYTSDCGKTTYNAAGNGGTGTIKSGYLEDSTTDTSTSLSSMIVCQQAYSSASQIVSADKEMYSQTIQLVT